MSRITTSLVAGASALAMIAGSFTAAEAAPLPAQNSVQVGGPSTQIDTVGWRRGYDGGGYGYRRGYGGRVAGAVAAGAALGIIGGALAASAAPRYGYDSGYGYPAYGYAPVRSYGYPAYGYDNYGW